MAIDASKVYNDLCTHLTACGWKYDRHDEDKVITLTMRGIDLPMELILAIKEEQEVICLYSPIRPTPPKEKRTEIGMAVNMANYAVIFGSFMYDAYDRDLQWHATLPYRDNSITQNQVHYLVMASCAVIDRYSAWFMMLGKGNVTLKQFYEFSKKL